MGPEGTPALMRKHYADNMCLTAASKCVVGVGYVGRRGSGARGCTQEAPELGWHALAGPLK